MKSRRFRVPSLEVISLTDTPSAAVLALDTPEVSVAAVKRDSAGLQTECVIYLSEFQTGELLRVLVSDI